MIAGVCEMAAGKAPPIATPTSITEIEEVASDDFPVTFSAQAVMGAQPPQVMLKSDGDGEEMESFEADLLAQETEDRLTQLMLDDELSDARLGLGAEPGSEQPLPHVESFTSSVSASQTVSTTEKVSFSQNPSGEMAGKTLRGSQERLNRTGSKSVVLTTHQELTLDIKEKERLEDSLIIAG